MRTHLLAALVTLALLPCPLGAQLRVASPDGRNVVLVDTHEVDYLTVDSKAFKATVYQPQGPGPLQTGSGVVPPLPL